MSFHHIKNTIRALLFPLALLAYSTQSMASEFVLHAFFADPGKIANAIGSKDEELQQQLLGMSDYISEKQLDEIFDSPDVWKQEVKAMISGNQRANARANSYALWMLYRAVADTPEQEYIGAPFVDLSYVSSILNSYGSVELAEYLNRIYSGNTTKPYDGLPKILQGKLGETEYNATHSAISAADAKIMLENLPVIDEIYNGLEEESSKVTNALRSAITANYEEYYKQESNLGDQNFEEAVQKAVEEELEDPYVYTEAIESIYFALEELKAWLQKSVSDDKAIFFIYESF